MYKNCKVYLVTLRSLGLFQLVDYLLVNIVTNYEKKAKPKRKVLDATVDPANNVLH